MNFNLLFHGAKSRLGALLNQLYELLFDSTGSQLYDSNNEELKVPVDLSQPAPEPFSPPNSLDISNSGYTSSQIDAYLIYHANNHETLNPAKNDMDIRGNDNPTAASADARQTLYDNYILVNYNLGYTP